MDTVDDFPEGKAAKVSSSPLSSIWCECGAIPPLLLTSSWHAAQVCLLPGEGAQWSASLCSCLQLSPVVCSCLQLSAALFSASRSSERPLPSDRQTAFETHVMPQSMPLGPQKWQRGNTNTRQPRTLHDAVESDCLCITVSPWLHQ
jgi:hypothetical protein